ncbi:Mitochondrial sorting-like protein [Diplonema papillatum]|nr:Mitochondrial sorting-like protein [Diplonema papillatum]|eukprot:gene11181-17192_t
MFGGHSNREQEQREFLQRLLATAVLQGAVLGTGFCMLSRFLHGGMRSRTVKIGDSWVTATGSEVPLLDCITQPHDIATDLTKVGGLADAKKVIKQCIIAPFQYADQFAAGSLRSPPKGVLLHGPPGTGKTLLAKAIAKTCGATFLEVKVESIFGKWLGESEQTVAAVFSLARKVQPCVVFVDELDSLLSHRNSMDNHAYSNAKTIFLRHWDGFATDERRHRIVVIGATNCPESLDAAVLRRLSVKVPVPYPSLDERRQILNILLSGEDLQHVEVPKIAAMTKNYSGADLKELCQDACRTQVYETFDHDTVRGLDHAHAPESQGTGFSSLVGYFTGGGRREPPPRKPPGAARAMAPLTTDMFISSMRSVQANDTFAANLRSKNYAFSRREDLD